MVVEEEVQDPLEAAQVEVQGPPGLLMEWPMQAVAAELLQVVLSLVAVAADRQLQVLLVQLA